MACCAFAAFILGQLILAWKTLVEMVTGKSAAASPDLAVAWSPGAPAAPRAGAPNFLAPAFAAITLLLLAEGVAVLALGFGAAEAGDALSRFLADSPLCRGLPLVAVETPAGPWPRS